MESYCMLLHHTASYYITAKTALAASPLPPHLLDVTPRSTPTSSIFTPTPVSEADGAAEDQSVATGHQPSQSTDTNSHISQSNQLPPSSNSQSYNGYQQQMGGFAQSQPPLHTAQSSHSQLQATDQVSDSSLQSCIVLTCLSACLPACLPVI